MPGRHPGPGQAADRRARRTASACGRRTTSRPSGRSAAAINYVSQREANANNTNMLPGYAKGDMTVAYYPWKNTEFRLNVLNISDTRYFDQVYQGHAPPAPGPDLPVHRATSGTEMLRPRPRGPDRGPGGALPRADGARRLGRRARHRRPSVGQGQGQPPDPGGQPRGPRDGRDDRGRARAAARCSSPPRCPCASSRRCSTATSRA